MSLKTTFLAILAAATVAGLQFGGASGSTGAPACYGDWSEAAATVATENLVTVETLGRQFRRRHLGDIVKTQLCRENGRFVYRLVIRKPDGRFENAVYDARGGLELGVANNAR